MTQITKPNTLTAGNPILATEHNENFNTLYNDFNGNITNYNFATTAGITDDKLAQIVSAGKVNFTAISTASATSGGLLYASSATSFACFAVGTSGQYLSWGTLLDNFEYASNSSAQANYVTNGGTYVDISLSNPGNLENFMAPSSGYIGIAQGFQTTDAGEISRFSFWMKRDAGLTGDFTGYIYSDTGGKPNAAVATFSTGTVGTDYGWVDFTGTFTPTVGTQYHIVVAYSNTADTGNWYFFEDNTSSWGDGAESLYFNSMWNTRVNDLQFRIYQARPHLQVYSESTIKTQGSYSLLAEATTGSLNNTLTRTISSPINLTSGNNLRFDIRSNRTGSNIKIGIHDSGGTTTETTPNITNSNIWQTISWSLASVNSSNKDAIDNIIITIVNADAANNFYLDNFYCMEPAFGWQGP